MAGEWRKTTLGEFVRLQRGHDLPERERRPGLVPIMGSAGQNGFHDTALAKSPGVVIGRSGVGSMGVVTYCTTDYWPHNTVLYITDFFGNDERFTYYFLHHLNLRRFDSGSAQASLNRNYIYPIRISVPDPPEQRAIACILGALDDKIELNRRMNRTMEAMARVIFQSWFVDFDPVRAKLGLSGAEGAAGQAPAGLKPEIAALFPDRLVKVEGREIPEGWEVASLDMIADFRNGLALQNYRPEGVESLPVIKIRELRQGNADENSDRASPLITSDCIIDDGDVVFSWSGSLLVDIWCGGRGALNQHLFKVTSRRYPKWFYYLWTQYHLEGFQSIAADKATTMGHIKRHHLSDAKVLVAPGPLIDRGTAAIDPLIDRMVSTRRESRTLTALRDTLLPKLISGALLVADAERIVGRCVS